jgi:hypothetical protein
MLPHQQKNLKRTDLQSSTPKDLPSSMSAGEGRPWAVPDPPGIHWYGQPHDKT